MIYFLLSSGITQGEAKLPPTVRTQLFTVNEWIKWNLDKYDV